MVPRCGNDVVTVAPCVVLMPTLAIGTVLIGSAHAVESGAASVDGELWPRHARLQPPALASVRGGRLPMSSRPTESRGARRHRGPSRGMRWRGVHAPSASVRDHFGIVPTHGAPERTPRTRRPLARRVAMVMATGSSRDRPDVDALRVYLNVVGEALWGQVGDEALDRGCCGGASARSRGRRARR